MLLSVSSVLWLVVPHAGPRGAGVIADIAQVQPQGEAETGADMLRTFLGDDMLIWGCMAMGLIAMVTVARVASRRRQLRKSSREVRAQANALHDFLSAVRAEHAGSQQGVWHYDFATGEEKYSSELLNLFAKDESEPRSADGVKRILKRAGIDLPKLARAHFEQAEPFEVSFALEGEGHAPRPMLLRACNLCNGQGEFQSMVAVIAEVSPPN